MTDTLDRCKKRQHWSEIECHKFTSCAIIDKVRVVIDTTMAPKRPPRKLVAVKSAKFSRRVGPVAARAAAEPESRKESPSPTGGYLGGATADLHADMQQRMREVDGSMDTTRTVVVPVVWET